MLSCHCLDAINTLGIKPSHRQIQQWSEYLDLLLKWNKAFNLTAVRERQQMEVLHLLDSLSIAPYISMNRLIDVGCGAGLPGIPLAILYPDKQFTLLDSNSKKTRFLQQAKRELKLNHIDIVHQRVESYQPEQRYDAVLSRAFTQLNHIVKTCTHLLNQSGQFLAMKGQVPQAEIRLLDQTIPIDIQRLKVPGLQAQRCLLRFGVVQ